MAESRASDMGLNSLRARNMSISALRRSASRSPSVPNHTRLLEAIEGILPQFFKLVFCNVGSGTVTISTSHSNH